MAALAEAGVKTRRETLAALMITKAPASDVAALGDVVEGLRQEMMVGGL